MRNYLALAALAAIAVPAAAHAADSDPAKVDVAFEALSEGRTAEAISRLETSSAIESAQPAALINLGTAYARQGRTADAQAAFTSALTARQHYYVELADGRWVDSRKAAKMALARLEKSTGLAMR